ncbi:DNA/RNA non-specific endonuclease [Neobacillus sp. 179-C4.2 HS]|uniref:DNA/RNA non-specific endonuclease n=1 Tax=Neobacillus driksii TaxID=3035913 RepID=A0ABV4YRH6_9BACI|nr:DNA/RNA non-specific endonuclease [Neobacillus sp. 179.-C4.2 HS]MDP5195034.1 DNA/RNA non-specific endonuclease [Neobacillus sp. 179.-C4.2 HS]
MKKLTYIFIAFLLVFLAACSSNETTGKEENAEKKIEEKQKEQGVAEAKEKAEKTNSESGDSPSVPATSTPTITSVNGDFDYSKYTQIVVDGGDMSGSRKPNARVDVGYGDREYWAFTNEYGQLIRVEAKNITLQNPNTENVLSSGRYYSDEAKVPGTESQELDEGHVIADSLGGVSNAYNITPQDSILNRHGDQAYMEKVIRDAGGCTDFVAVIQYPNTQTQIPNHYKFTYKIQGRTITDEFDNVNPDEVNKNLGETTGTSSTRPKTDNVPANETVSSNEDVSRVDTNHNGSVTIAEAKAAGFKMPITRDSWLYKYMDDRDGDGLVGE